MRNTIVAFTRFEQIRPTTGEYFSYVQRGAGKHAIQRKCSGHEQALVRSSRLLVSENSGTLEAFNREIIV